MSEESGPTSLRPASPSPRAQFCCKTLGFNQGLGVPPRSRRWLGNSVATATKAVDPRIANRFGGGEPNPVRNWAWLRLPWHRDAQSGPEHSLEANAPPVLCMAPKKEKGGTAGTSSKIWEPSLIAAHFNQVSPESRKSPLFPAVPEPGRTPQATPPGSSSLPDATSAPS